MVAIGFIFIATYFVIIFLVVEISVCLLIMTGLEREIARFQVISMLTSTGFTTKESELILRHPIRRKICLFLILFGAFSLAVVISTISSILSKSFRFPQLFTVAGLLAVIYLILKNRRIGERLSKRLEHRLEKEFEMHELPIREVLYLSDSDLVTGIPLFKDSTFIGSSVSGLFGPEEDINPLFISRGEVKIRKGLWRTELSEGDVLFLYGDRLTIERKFRRELAVMERKVLDEKNVSSLE